MKNLNLSSEMIEDKVFNVDFKGYSPLEVDSYLDLIIEDYDSLIKMVDSLEAKLTHYEQVIDDLSQQNQLLLGKLSSSDQVNTNHSTIDLVRRVARLEEIVFNQNK